MSIPAYADNAKNIDDMTLEELREEYLELQEEYDKIKLSIEDETEMATESSVQMSEEEFKKDIVDSYNNRFVVSNKYSIAEQNVMTDEEYVNYLNDCAEAEHIFYEKYKNATFEDLNIQYLCNQYILGLQKQYNAKTVWDETNDAYKYRNEFDSGYYNRAYVIVELSDYYNLSFGDIEGMRTSVAYMDAFNEAETRNKDVDHEIVQKTQQLLNDIGFYCGEADGISGKRTVKSIKRFQEMYGYEPVDGIIDEELVGQLELELAKK